MEEMDTLDDLIARVALGDRAAFRCVYDRTSAKLFGVCLRILKERSEAEDTVQEVYTKVWHAAGSYSASTASAMSWLIAIARNRSIDRLRARRPEAGELAQAEGVSDPSPSPEARTVRSDERRALDKCLGELDERHAAVIRGAYLEGYTYEELAVRQSVPLGTMKSWIRRSLIKLRKCLER